MFSIEVKNRGQVIAKISMFQNNVMNALEKHMDDTTKAVARKERMIVPVKSGKLKKTIRKRVDKRGLYADVGPKLRARYNPLTHLVERGTKPHPIHPYGNKKATVMHPGTKARPFVEPVWAQEEGQFIKGVEDIVRRAAK